MIDAKQLVYPDSFFSETSGWFRPAESRKLEQRRVLIETIPNVGEALHLFLYPHRNF
jgi:hypothetical protein